MLIDKKCIDCKEYKNCRDSFASWFFFILGLVATVAVRAVTVLVNMNPLYGKIAWYIGIGGFFVFFVYKFKVNQARYHLITKKDILAKINSQKALSGEDYNALGAIICSLASKKERINYFFIFGLSALALLLAIYMDFLR